MPERIFERLNYLIDRNIEWSIRADDEDKREAVRAAGVIGVLHDLLLNIGGVKIKNHVFVVPNASAPLLFGRTFERATQATFINEDDGSLTLMLKSQDGAREVVFQAAPTHHERNRETVWPRSEEFYADMVMVDLGEDSESDWELELDLDGDLKE